VKSLSTFRDQDAAAILPVPRRWRKLRRRRRHPTPGESPQVNWEAELAVRRYQLRKGSCAARFRQTRRVGSRAFAGKAELGGACGTGLRRTLREASHGPL
jgi:hypothetical protein